MCGSMVRIHQGSPFSSILGPHRLAWPRTPPFHGGDRGSNPLGDAIFFGSKPPNECSVVFFAKIKLEEVSMMELSDQMVVWVDNDATPRQVREIILKLVEKISKPSWSRTLIRAFRCTD